MEEIAHIDIKNDEGLVNTLNGQHSNSDLVSGVYEGGLKVWDCAFDLVTFVKENRGLVEGKNVLEIGCGQGLPGVMCLKEGAAFVAFQDFN